MNVKILKDLSYSDGSTCKLDIYAPHRCANRPVVMVVHGGAWMIGDKSLTSDACKMICDSGIIAVTCNYQLSPIPKGPIRQVMWWTTILGTLSMLLLSLNSMTVVIFLACMLILWVLFIIVCEVYDNKVTAAHSNHIGDVEKAFRWIENNISRYGGKPDCIILMGHSAGAHLVSLLSSRMPQVKGVICISGVYSWSRLKQITLGEWLVRCAFGKHDDYVTQFPIMNVHADVPPHLLINATWDLTLIRHTWDMLLTLKASGVYVRAHRFGGDHFTITKGWDSYNKPVWDYIHKFILEILDIHDNPVTLKTNIIAPQVHDK